MIWFWKALVWYLVNSSMNILCTSALSLICAHDLRFISQSLKIDAQCLVNTDLDEVSTALVTSTWVQR